MIELDTSKLERALDNISPSKQKQAFRKALKKGAQVLRKETQEELLRSGIKGVKRYSKWGTTLYGGVWSGANKSGEAAYVHINERRARGDFRLKFFEMGTQIRKTKQGYNRGRIKRQYNFFAKTVDATKKPILDLVSLMVSDSILKSYNKK